MSSWTEEKIEELKKLWAEGLTTGEIGKRLGVSKNAVVGKAHRLDLESRPSPIKRAVSEVKEVVQKEVAQKEVVSEPKAPVRKKLPVKEVDKKNKKTKISDLTSTSCRWPVGDPKEEDFHFCGKETFNGKPYCLEHCAVAYVGINKKGG
ncbi:MAG: GcrA cell cycle regulator [Alphaproteobacteria bacterium ADurb.Bin438]|nr:MAG: GcrA cell cycle regulator [Alphaproteobacteria bacterium ADurb.Bin438]